MIAILLAFALSLGIGDCHHAAITYFEDGSYRLATTNEDRLVCDIHQQTSRIDNQPETLSFVTIATRGGEITAIRTDWNPASVTHTIVTSR